MAKSKGAKVNRLITGSSPADDDLEDARELLDRVELRSFSVTPEIVQPFESATVEWRADVPAGVFLRLNNRRVAPSGRRVVNPTRAEIYRLYASARGASAFLGARAVNVALSHCHRGDSSLIDELLGSALADRVEKDSRIYFRLVPVPGQFGLVNHVQSRPEVTIAPGRIAFRLRLKAVVDHFPDPDVDVEASFGLALAPVPDQLTANSLKFDVVPKAVEVRVNVTFPWYAYLAPGAPIALPIAASMAEDSARKSFAEGIEEFTRRLLNWRDPPGLIKHGINIYVDDFGEGIVEIEFCPPPQPGLLSGDD